MDFFCNFGQVEGKISLVGGGAPAFRPDPAGFGGAPCPAAGASVRHQSKRLLHRWKQPGDVTDIPRHGVYTEFDTRLLEDASFLRLKNLMLSYTFPRELLRKTRFISGVRIYAQAQNLLTFTNFSGLDPEGNGNTYAAEYPMTRQFTFGLDLTF